MLSRVADGLYWMARYIERAGNAARLLDANAKMLLDVGRAPAGDSLDFWKPVLDACALTDLYEERKAALPLLEVPFFLGLDPGNAESVRSSIAHARENARMVRDQISEEMWLELNTLHLFFDSGEAEREWGYSIEDFCARIVRFSLLFQGLTDATVPHGEGWNFIQTGICLERADKTSRILDVPHRHDGLKSSGPWGAVLRSCSAGPAYRELYGGEVDENKVIALLVFSDSFPRSIRYCLRRIDEMLHAISGVPQGQFSNEAERLTGAALASLDFANPYDIADCGLPAYMDQIQVKLNEIAQKLFEAYVLLPSEIDGLSLDSIRNHAQQQHFSHQQQQQQQ